MASKKKFNLEIMRSAIFDNQETEDNKVNENPPEVIAENDIAVPESEPMPLKEDGEKRKRTYCKRNSASTDGQTREINYNIAESLYQKLKESAEVEGVTVNEKVRELIQARNDEDMSKPTALRIGTGYNGSAENAKIEKTRRLHLKVSHGMYSIITDMAYQRRETVTAILNMIIKEGLEGK